MEATNKTVNISILENCIHLKMT